MLNEDLSIDNLEGVGPATKQKLIEGGISNLLELSVIPPADIAALIGIELGKAVDFCSKARKRLQENGLLEQEFVTASKIYEKRQTIKKISTGCKSLDDLFQGGIESQALTEVYGEFGSGKTQICHTVCVMVQLPVEEGGLNGNAIYVDTENTFRPERIVSIAESRGLDKDKVLENIIVAKAYNSSHQELIVSEIAEVVVKNKIKLLIVDSCVAHYRSEFVGRGTLAERQQRLNRFMHLLLRIAEMHDVAIIMTNQVQSKPDTVFGDPSKPTGGNVVAHASTYRVYLRKAGRNRIARMVDSPYHAEAEAPFTLNEKGVDDIDESLNSKKNPKL